MRGDGPAEAVAHGILVGGPVALFGATDGEVVDRYGLHWLLGFESEDATGA